MHFQNQSPGKKNSPSNFELKIDLYGTAEEMSKNRM